MKTQKYRKPLIWVLLIRTALFIAVLSGHQESVTILLERGAEVDARDVDGNTPLFAAAFVHKPYIADMLVCILGFADILACEDAILVQYCISKLFCLNNNVSMHHHFVDCPWCRCECPQEQRSLTTAHCSTRRRGEISCHGTL